jgi:glutathione S-transferase
MNKLTLFHFPGACSRVTMTALEAANCDYEDVMVNLPAGDHLRPEYRATNPRGKVPALAVGNQLLTENGAIISWINAEYPQARLLPIPANAFEQARQLSDLFWLSSVWHPSVRAMKMPIRWTVGDIEPVRERGRDLLNPLVDALEQRLGENKWYYGMDWSITDIYFYWAYTTAEQGGYDLTGRAQINRHRADVEGLSAVQAARHREEAARDRWNAMNMNSQTG